MWDVPQAPPAGLRAPLWWIGDASAFPELKNGYADSARGRLWSVAPPPDADAGRTLFERWQRLHYPALAYAAPTQVIAATPSASMAPASGALHAMLAYALMALFALERILAHAHRR